MRSEENIDAWLASAPKKVVSTTERLMAQVEEMRSDQVIYPAQGDILNALAFVAPQDVRVVILGQDPYHGPSQAMGLSFSVPAGEKLPPSLKNIYKEMCSDLGCMMPVSGDLTSWAEQGVLLLNTTLTVVEHQANSHSKLGWQVLTSFIVKRCMELPQVIVFMGWGKPAIKLIDGARAQAQTAGADTSKKHCLSSTHPSPLSANRAGKDLQAFMGSCPFSKANALLAANGETPIAWDSVAR